MSVGFNSVPNPVIDISLLLPLLSLAMAVEACSTLSRSFGG